VSGESILPVGEQQLLITPAVEFRLLCMNSGQLRDQAGEFIMFCLAFFQADAGPQGGITFTGPCAFQAPFPAIINRRNARKGKEQSPCQRQMCLLV